MISIKCLSKIRNNAGIIVGYNIQDISNGDTKSVTPEELKCAIRNNKVCCINLQLTKDNRIVDKKDNLEKAITKSRVVSGIREIEYENATYVIQGGRVLLKEVHIISGEFEIPGFVDGIMYRDTNEVVIK